PRARGRRKVLVQKPRGQFTSRVQAVGPEHFGIVTVDCAKVRSKFMLADFFGTVHVPPTVVAHRQGELQAAAERIRHALRAHQLADFVVAIERTGEYHRPVQRAFRELGWDVRLVHPFATYQYRQPADPGNKTDDTDLAALHRATVNGFGLTDTPWPDDYQQWQLLMRQRRRAGRRDGASRPLRQRQCHHGSRRSDAEPLPKRPRRSRQRSVAALRQSTSADGDDS